MTDTRGHLKPPAGVNKSLLTFDRLRMLDHIVDNGGETNFQSLAFYLDVTPSSLNNHLTKLEGAGLIRTEKRFVNARPETKATMTETGWRAYNDLDAQFREWNARNDERRADGRLRKS